MTYYKAIRPEGTDFFTGTVRWAPEDEPAVPGSVVRHPWSTRVGPEADDYLSASTVVTDCTGMWWPCRLLEVEPVEESGRVIEPVTPEPRLPNKRAAVRWRIVRELPAHEALGPQGKQIVALMERAGRFTEDEAGILEANYATTSNIDWRITWHAAYVEGREAAWNAVYYVTRSVLNTENVAVFAATADVVRALVVRRPH